MSHTRIRMPEGHLELCLEGNSFKPDEEGSFFIPDKYVPELKRIYGAVEEPSIADLEALAKIADDNVMHAEQAYEQAEKDAKAAHARVDARKKAKADKADPKNAKPSKAA